MTDGEHIPVLLNEAMAALSISQDDVVVDATFGRGGHARAILAALGPRGRLVAIDRDPAAATAARDVTDNRFTFRHAWFSELPEILAAWRIDTADAVLVDLGVSSPQLDDATRGFSYRFEGPLDMRMDPMRGESAADFLARASVEELTDVIHDYGEERFAQSIARAIAAARVIAPIVSTKQLAAIIGKAVGARTRGDWRQDPAARTFQALRIVVNREFAELSTALPRITALLSPGARLAVISFHSLEDRIVKRFIAFASQPFGGDPRIARLALRSSALPEVPLRKIGRAQKPSIDEVRRNPRSRSAVLRVAERTDAPLPADWPHGWSGVS
ncbi:MAG: 16S rRNA (cytosine(1402)-N(4))-methyltransferase RsmH [Betaproteobacteria bacterium]|nr:MAG: 16S rRNA (cytosine(1402)-N(4))-methyltransferase RsmH [Betaproteobacteria bacterium]